MVLPVGHARDPLKAKAMARLDSAALLRACSGLVSVGITNVGVAEGLY